MVDFPTLLLFGIALPFLFGSIPFGLLITISAGIGDIRNIGSGNVGATNVLRSGKKHLALATLLCDAGKGALAVIIARLLSDDGSILPLAAAVAVVLGHMFSPWLQFKGGKGVATTAGVMLGLSWPVGIMVILIWAAVAWKTRYSSLAALSAAALTPLLGLIFADWKIALTYFVIIVFVFWRHEENIRRLIAGTESKIGK